MILFINFCLIVVLLNGVSVEFVDDVALTAITDVPQVYLHQLYSDDVSPDPPMQWEERTNQELTRRLRICRELFDHDVFKSYGRIFVDMARDQEQLRDELTQPRYEEIYHDLFTDGELTNRFRPRKFNISKANIYPSQLNANLGEFVVEDHVFTCLVREEFRGRKLIPVYVTKLYNGDSKLHAHRFLLNEVNGYLRVKLAEAPAEVYAPPDFSIKDHYLELKRNNPQSVTSKDCSLDSIFRFTKDDEYHRLCVIVLSSPYFKEKGVSLVRHLPRCFTHVTNFSFRPREGEEVTDESPYSEIVTPCYAHMNDRSDNIFFLSKAYKDNQVLVSVQEPLSIGKFYLDSLFVNVGILTERLISSADVQT